MERDERMGKPTISRTTIAKGVTACVSVLATLGILQIGEYQLPIKEETGADAADATAAEGAEAAAGAALTLPEAPYSFTPGTYASSAKGISSDITVKCTFDETSMTAMEADVSGETAGIGTEIGDAMIQAILSAQTPQVDGISGATISSDALKSAVAECFKAAAGLPSAAQTESQEPEAASATGETDALSDAPDTDETEITSEAASDVPTEGDTEAASDAPAATSTGAGALTVAAPGTYTASATGISSDVTVTCTFDSSSLASMEADVSGETAGIGAEIGDKMVSRFLEAQSPEIDGVAGATITSDALKSAAADCFAQAGAAAAALPEESENETEAMTDASTEAPGTKLPAESIYKPGTYTALAKGMQGNVTVSCTFDETGIVAVGIYVGEEEPESGGAAGKALSAQLMDAQSAEIDGVTGATVTSDAVKTAAADCIAQASKADSTSSAPLTSASLYTPGTYSASMKGISSDVTVTLTFDEAGITAAGINVSGEGPDIGATIADEVSLQLLNAQSAEIDGVSGATITSDAVKGAAADCIAQAQITG